MRAAEVIGGAFLALAGMGLLYFRTRLTLYSYRVDTPTQVAISGIPLH
jgi:hypothetical protein